MRPVHFPQETGVLQKPPSMTDDECSPLPVWAGDGKVVISCWKMDWRDRFAALFRGRLWVFVWGGHTQPPIAFDLAKTVFQTPVPNKPQKRFRWEVPPFFLDHDRSCVLPRGYGVAYVAHDRDRLVLAWLPFNKLIGWWRLAAWKLRAPGWQNKAIATAVAKAFSDGVYEGERRQQEKLARLIERVEKMESALRGASR